MNLFVIGDVHGCFHTLQELIKHWQPATELLVQTGDIVDRGNYSLECLELARTLETQGPTVFLLGNHEHEMLKHYAPNGPNANWLRWGGRVTAQQYQGRPSLLQEHLAWIKQHPLFWTNEHLLISHAALPIHPIHLT
ncbi:metallophosphoesterase [Hymenobacter sp. AT01-02]|uniref:metallophosphoesterase n=1 Tax=Hymenobacter sp. AT01-02 TaxID=1571877 RepID=UPI000697312B|nr:metallophosphoesterase [Hymenobacter sp. AT01-02]